MTTKKGKRLSPEMLDLAEASREEIFRNMNCVKIGKVISVDGTKKTADIQILFKRVDPKTAAVRSYTVLKACPLFTLQGGGGAFQAPVAAGDHVIVLFSDRNLENWYKTGSEAAPTDARAHHLSDGIALVGLNWEGGSLENYATDELKMTYGGAKVGLKGGKVIIKNVATDLKTAFDAFFTTLTAAKVTVSGTDYPLSSATITALNVCKATFDALLDS